MTRTPSTSVGRIVTALAIALLPLGACTADSATGPSFDVTASAAVMSPGGVSTLAATTVTDSTVTVRWTQINDGTGKPASYRVKYALPAIAFGSATIGCNSLKGTQIGAQMSCTIAGLARGTRYDFQLMSYRLQGSTWTNALYSNIAAGQTTAPAVLAPKPVQDLAITGTTESSLTMRWTEVDGGGGVPASYRLKYALPAIQWSSATTGCASTISGTSIGAQISCTVTGLASGTPYELQLMSFKLVNGAWLNSNYSNVAAGATTVRAASAVQDLRVTDPTNSSLTVRWTQVEDGTGAPAAYLVKFASPPLQWSSAATGCTTLLGTQVGVEMSCTIQGLASGATYDVQVMSSRIVNGAPQGSAYSNISSGTVGDPGIWVSASRLRQLPTSGTAWSNVLATANSACGTVNLSNQDQSNNVCIMAKALVFARIGGTQYRADVVSAINQIAFAPAYVGSALALGRELAAYVIAADLIDLRNFNPSLDARFRTTLMALRTTYTPGAASSIIDCHERRPNNWGAHCGATRIAIAVYLDDQVELARAAQVFRGYLGDRASYAGFDYGDLSWQCDPTRPVGINPVGCVKNGLSLDGVLPDDQRRGGTFTTTPPQENYVWEAMQGLVAQAVMLERAGYAPFDWSNRALLRATRWLHDVNGFAAVGDDTWQPHVLNDAYGTSFPEQVPSQAGKNVGWTDWTHR